METLKVSQINIYPVKSCAGLSLQSALVVDTGFEYDRQWMVVDSEGKFVTQRQYAKMSLIKTTLIDNGVHFEAPGMQAIDVQIVFEGKKIETDVWGNACVGIDQGEVISKWLTEYIGKECHLIIMSPDFKRGVSEKYKVSGNEAVGFADGFPFLLISEESLNELNSKLKDKLQMNRFRPNIVISGGTSFQEDTWKKIKIGDVVFRFAKPCARCEITTIDQATGEKGIEPLETLGSYRTKPKGIMFGQNLIQENTGTIHVGDVVTVIE
jgi:uncharacterized protein YcbX